MSVRPTLTIVGIGADGWTGLSDTSRAAIEVAQVLVGSKRQLALVPPTDAIRRPWPSPIDPLLDELVAGTVGPACILASGDPMLHGIGATLARRVAAERLMVYPHPSSFAIACARLGWPAAEVELLTLVGRPVETLVRLLQPARRLIAFVTGEQGAADAARIVREAGCGPSRFVVLEQLGGADERITESTAAAWVDRRVAALHLVAIECRSAPEAGVRARTPGLDDDAYAHDGQLTRREVRAITLAALAPLPTQLLWDVGAGSGSISIEWLRAEATARAVAVERRLDRAERARGNARRLGVPELDVRVGEAPGALAALDAPDAVFIGGGLTTPTLLELCWDRLRPGGRLVANAVTLEGEQVLCSARAERGGRLVRIAVSHAEPIGDFTAWRPQLPIVQWAATKKSP